MNFVSLGFIVFLIVTVVLFYSAPKSWREPLLLAASYLFYATWSIPFIGVIIVTTSIDYWMSHLIADSNNPKVRRWALVSGLVMNLSVLAYFKYTNFFLETTWSLGHWWGWSLSLPQHLDIILPLGISFYTFEAISYMIDVYRGEKPAPSWLRYNFYIMYFPHLISGPIIRFHELWPQYAKGINFPHAKRLIKGFELVVLGYFFKTVVADQAAVIADPVFNHPETATAFSTYLGALAFTVQIYFDFMAYTHIARGVSLFFNLQMPLNFDHPYNATTISHFWERWHISLSRWIRDYLYFPLGGSKVGLSRTMNNLVITMTLCGAWHGAGWPYILWGVYHGVLLAAYHGLKAIRKQWQWLNGMMHWPGYNTFCMVSTFVLVVIGWVLFRSSDLPTTQLLLTQMTHLTVLVSEVRDIIHSGHLKILAQLGLLLVCCFSGPWWVQCYKQLSPQIPGWMKLQAACILLLLSLVFTSSGNQTFIYFQF